MRAKEDKGKTIWVLSPYSSGTTPIGRCNLPLDGELRGVYGNEQFGLKNSRKNLA